MRALLELAQAAAGLWLIPWGPVAAALVGTWATGWMFPAMVGAIFTLGWPWTWYRWVMADTGEDNGDNEQRDQIFGG